MTYLGYLAWFSIVTTDGGPTVDVVKDDLNRWFKELGLKTQFLPKPIRTVDAFRRATSATSEHYVSDDGKRYRLSVMDYKSDGDTVTRHVIRDGVAHSVRPERVANITFYRPRRRSTGRINGTEDVKYRVHSGLRGVDKEKVDEFVAACMARYSRSLAQMTPHQVRAVLRDYLTHVGAIRQLGESVYFIPLDAHEEIAKLATVIQRCGDRCRMMLIPLVDGPEYRDMLREAIDLDIATRARRTLHEIGAWIEDHAGEAPGRLTMHGWRSELRTLHSRVTDFNARYGMTFPAAADSLEDLQVAIEPWRGVRPSSPAVTSNDQ